MASRIFLMVLAVACAAALAGCGGEKDGGEEKAKEAAAAASAPVCDMTSTIDASATKLPSDFPTPDGVTYRETKSAGPSQVVDATYAGSLDAAYDAYESAVNGAGYDVLFKEKEDKDAEISYKGGGTTGQIALRDVCGESDKLVVHITNRPQ
jgi:hypothetical protein